MSWIMKAKVLKTCTWGNNKNIKHRKYIFTWEVMK